MALLLGIDTGGTFTDAVLVSDDGTESIVASAKSPTTHHRLEIGVGAALARVLDEAPGVERNEIALVSLSTTLATNALVEGHGEPAALISFGFSPAELLRAGLADAVDSDAIATLGGGHDAHGNEREPFPEAELRAAIERLGERVSAFAVTSQFSVRNPAHEQRAVAVIRELTDAPVTTSSELSARLNGPRRAVTTALNARLLGTIDRLNRAVRSVLAAEAIQAPLMVVRGDGSLVSADFVAERPIETVLSGPAASVVGALHLVGVESALVADIGGTTTDVAIVNNRRPAVSRGGATVGGYRTMVEAVDMSTVGLGGDSEVRIDTRDRSGPVLLGPERAIPIGKLAAQHPQVLVELERQLGAQVGLTSHGRFLVASAVADNANTDARERGVLDRLSSGPRPEAEAAPSGLDARAATRLRARGLVRVATLTPTDSQAIVTGDDIAGVDSSASLLAASVLARQTSSNGRSVFDSGEMLAERVVELLVRRSGGFALGVGLAADGIDIDESSPLLQAALDHHRGAADVGLRVALPLVAIGAAASAYYPQVSELVRTESIVPEHAEVANALGAVVGRVRVRQTCTITQPTRGQFRVHRDDQPTFGSVDNALAAATALLTESVLEEADRAGARTPEVAKTWAPTTAWVEGKEVFVEGTLTLEATARPKF